MTNFRSQLFFDLEVKAFKRNALDDYGIDVYSRHPGTKILLASYAIDNGPEQVVDVYHRQPAPPDLRDALRDPQVQVVAHNAPYDRVVLMNTGQFPVPIDRWYDTRARAYAHGLPGALDTLCAIFKLGDASKRDGDKFIELFCEQGADPDKHPQEWAEFMVYSRFDITALRALYQLLPHVCYTSYEQAAWGLIERINERGFMVDKSLANAMIAVDNVCSAKLDQRVTRLSDSLITRGTQRERVKDWLEDRNGLVLPNMRAETLRKTLRDANEGRVVLSAEQREMISLRLLSSKSSLSKCATALRMAGPGDRIRYSTTYGGGGRNGRVSHKGFQPGNLPRPERGKETVELAIDAIKGGYAIDVWGDEASAVCSDALRGLIVAPEGFKLLQADLSQIQGRLTAWIAGEDWKLIAYRNKDAGIGEDFYKLLWHKMTGTPLALIDDFKRQQGKGTELSMGFQGGVGAYINIASSYRIDLHELAAQAPRMLPAEYMERGRSEYEWAVKMGRDEDLPPAIYAACSALKHAWRDASPATESAWQTLDDCAKVAVQNPGKQFTCLKGKITFQASSEWLAMRTPSGRLIMFAKPQIRAEQQRDADGKPTGKVNHSISAMKSDKGRWIRDGLYGGVFMNAAAQGGERDILLHCMFALEREGFPLILSVHDEVVAELPESDPRTHDDAVRIMTRPIPGFEGLPLAAGGYTAKRFKKG